MDITPTVLHALGVPVPSDMDGRVLANIFDEEFITDRPVVYREKKYKRPLAETAEIYDADEETVIRDRLKGLGYID